MDLKEHQINLQMHTSQNHPWEYARFFVVNDLIRPFCDKSIGACVDVGCGDVFFLNQLSLKHKGVFIAIDTAFDTQTVAEISRKYSDMEVTFCSHIQEVDLHGDKANVIFLMDVIEHISDPKVFLEELRAADFVDEDTLWVITVPAYQSLFSQHDVWLEHFQRYNLKSLRKTLEDSHLKELRSGYFFFSLFLARSLRVALEKGGKKKKEQTGIGAWTGSSWLAQVIVFVLKADYLLFGKLLKMLGVKIPGLSAYMLCKTGRG